MNENLNFGKYCFNEKAMREWLPARVYEELKQVQEGQKNLSLELADVIAEKIKEWAVSLGATHFTHWFQPLTGYTAEKQDSFVNPNPECTGDAILEFSGKELIKGEPDASSFPNGGLRSTFEARGYTAWDTTSPVFIKRNGDGSTLTIPTIFISYTGEALDKKTPLLRSMEALNKTGLRFLKALGYKEAVSVTSEMGAEQEYFLVDEEFYRARPDLCLAGRSLFGAAASKGQELDDHYFGSIKPRVASFMDQLNRELWEMGVFAKTQHNEVAPHQFELAPIYAISNLACDQNQLVMETMKRIANEHGMTCLLHEKPFRGINGSGKHNNWSVGSEGINFFKPGKEPEKNSIFLLSLVSVLKGVDLFARQLRATAAVSGNDHRLGANEAPPAIISVFIGEELTRILEDRLEGRAFEKKSDKKLELGSSRVPDISQDNSDRNRTSPFAFTGNKFEFRMPGSTQSVSGPNIVLNLLFSEILEEVAERLERCDDIEAETESIIKEFYREHRRIVFNGNGYSKEWEEEAEKRGLPNIRSTVEALTHYLDPNFVTVAEKHEVLTHEELKSRVHAYLEIYSKEINIEASTMASMAEMDIIPAALAALNDFAQTIERQKSAGLKVSGQSARLKALSESLENLLLEVDNLKATIKEAHGFADEHEQAECFRDKVFPAMEKVRSFSDMMQPLVGGERWPYPTDEDMLFRL